MSELSGPLDGIKVLELGQVIAGPFCGQVLADMGADVLKVEPPDRGDVLRQWGWYEEGRDSLWWRIAARGKRSVTIDLRKPEGQQLARRLAREVDILVENFRPGTLEKWGLGYDDLSSENPGLVMVRISGFGQDGPYSDRPGYAAIGEAMGGLRALTGYADRPPARVGISLGDSLTGLMGALGAVVALVERSKTGLGQIVDASIYESVLAITESVIPEWQVAGRLRPRSGPTLDGIAPSNVYPTADGEVLIAANQDTVFARLAGAMGRPDLTSDPRFADHRARGQNMQELDGLIASWTRPQLSADVLSELHVASVPCGLVYAPADMLADPHFLARQSLVEVEDPEYGPLRMPAVAPRLSRTPGRVRWSGPRLGAHTEESLAAVGVSSQAISELRNSGVI